MRPPQVILSLLLSTFYLVGPCWAQAYRGDKQLIRVCAPYALYPDTLLAQILLASAYPQHILEAHAWRNNHAHLRGAALAEGLSYQGWNGSVKALCPFSWIMKKMIDDMSGTTSLGAYFKVDKASTMDCIQDLRAQAIAKGALTATPQQKIVGSNGTIQILPTDPDTIYVPTYDATALYSEAGYGPGFLTFGTGVALGERFKDGYAAFNWKGRVVYTGAAVYASFHGGKPLGNTSEEVKKP
jgi:hypothetical protein